MRFIRTIEDVTYFVFNLSKETKDTLEFIFKSLENQNIRLALENRRLRNELQVLYAERYLIEEKLKEKGYVVAQDFSIESEN